MDAYRADQLIGDYGTLKHFDDFLENTKFESKRCNVFASMKNTYFYIALWFILFEWKAFGFGAFFNPYNLFYIGRMLALSIQAVIGEAIFKFKTRKLANNSQIAKMREDFRSYRYRTQP